MSRQTVGFFDNYPMMTAAANGGDGPQCVFKSVHRYAGFLLGAKAGSGGRSGKAALRLCARGRNRVPSAAASQDLP